MRLERIEDRGLSQYSYLVACPGAGVAAVVDPRRDVDVYLDLAARRRLEIAYVLETHIHADFASGARELAGRTGATLCLSAYDRGETYEVRFDHRALASGDALELGSVRLEARHTPGHTPEHLAFLVYDTSRSRSVPMAMLSGDFLFVGALGRPDLLGEEQKEGLARRMFQSVRALAELPDGLEVHPGHGAGSMCGAGMGGRPVSTLGYERIANPYLDPGLSEDTFVERLLGNVPPFPPYYRRMKELNSWGPPPVSPLPGRRAVSPDELRRRLEDGAVVVDLRDPVSFGGGHLPGSFGIGLGSSVSTWAAWVVPYDRPLVLVVEDPRQVEDAVRRLVRVGLDHVVGYLDGGIDAWAEAGGDLATVRQVDPHELEPRWRRGEVEVLDVRTRPEWEDAHIPGARWLAAGEVGERIGEVAGNGTPLAVVCATGYRSTVAASVLQRGCDRPVLNLTGGMAAWQRAGLPVE